MNDRTMKKTIREAFEAVDIDRIIGELITEDKYRFADKAVIAEAARDTMRIILIECGV